MPPFATISSIWMLVITSGDDPYPRWVSFSASYGFQPEARMMEPTVISEVLPPF